MKTLRIATGVLFFGLLVCALPAYPSEPVDGSNSRALDIQAIRELEQAFFDAEDMGDFEAWLNFFTQDAVVMQPHEMALNGRTEIRQRNASTFAQYELHEETDFREIEVTGDLGYIRAHWTWIMTPKKGGEPIEDNGDSIWIVRKQPDGTWKIARGIFNSDHPVRCRE